MAVETGNFANIENGILSRLQAKALKDGRNTVVTEFDIRKGVENIDKTPAVSVVMEECDFTKVGKNVIRMSPVFAVYLVFKSLKSEEARRQGTYPMVEGAVQILVFSDLGLEIDPLLPSGKIQEIVADELKDRGMICFRIPFKTNFEVDKLSDGDAEDLLSIGIEYFLKAGDDIVDATDEVDLSV